MTSWREMGGAAVQLGTAISRAVDAVGRPEPYETAVAELVALPAEPTGLVLGTLLRIQLEDRHPDGLDGEDIEAVLERCYHSAAAWLPAVQPSVLLAALASALGIHEPGITYPDGSSTVDSQVPVPTAAEYARHAPLLIADLLAGRSLSRHLDTAFTDLYQSQTMELP